MKTMMPDSKALQLADLPDLLTVAEMADFLRIGRGKAYRLLRERVLPSVRLGNAVRVPKVALVGFLTPEDESRENARS